MQIAKSSNLALAFILELCALAAFCYWGFRTGDSTALKILLGLGAPLLAALAWGVFAAPKSRTRLKGAALLAFGIAFFALAALGLYAAGQPGLAIALAVAYAINRVLVYAWGQ